MGYDFKTLSSLDFELLVRDLLQLHLTCKLESFKAGKDNGIDLRGTLTDGMEIIIQCKHYVVTGMRGLIGALKKEVEKVKKLNPQTYCIVTSAALSPDNKTDIQKIFTAYCKNNVIVYGQEDLNNFLGLYPEIEERNYKLWLTSSAILNRIVHARLYNQTTMFIESMQEKIKLYVQNDSFFDAWKILNDNNYCIISGIPGIGKTFLAEILLLRLAQDGYRPFVIQNNIQEAYDVLHLKEKLAFYYDDFLGQTGYQEKLEKNEEQNILNFINKAKGSKSIKFILTTREYILQQAKTIYEKLQTSGFDYAKCIINLESYTRREKAHILFNHLYFSHLPNNFKSCLAESKNLLKIVDHQNYSPRLVEWMSTQRNIVDFNPEEYLKYFLETLHNPSKLWDHAFKTHISAASRSLLLTLMTFPKEACIEDIKIAFDAFRDKELLTYKAVITPHDFRTALKELEASFVKCQRYDKVIIVSFNNPSVRDYLENYIVAYPEIFNTLYPAVMFYDQFSELCRLHNKMQNHLIEINEKSLLIEETIVRCVSKSARQYLFRNSSNINVRSIARLTSISDNIAHALNFISNLQYEPQERIASKLLFIAMNDIHDDSLELSQTFKIIEASIKIRGIDPVFNTFVYTLIDQYYKKIDEFVDIEDFVSLKKFIEKIPGRYDCKALIDKASEQLDGNADGYFDDSIGNATDDDDIDDLKSIVSDMEDFYGTSLSTIEDSINDRADEISAEKSDDNVGSHVQDKREKNTIDATDSEIIDMFELFRESPKDNTILP